MKNKKMVRPRPAMFLLVMTAALLTALSSFAEELKPKVELMVRGEKEVVRVRNGKKAVELAPLDNARGGDVLLYTVTYHNSGKSVARNVEVVDPIPANTVYVPGSATGKTTKILFSINGGATYLEPPVTYRSRDNAGKEVVQPAPPEMYTHIKWIVPSLGANASGTASFKVKVK